jgi:DNA-binding response OmpR family regulator
LAQLLVVSPDATLREAVQRCASSLGHDTFTSASAADARRALGRVHVDVVCLDSVLPPEGIELLCQTVAASTNGRTPRLVYLGPPAAKLVPATLPASLRDKIDGFVAKPVDAADLVRELARVLSDHPPHAGRDNLLRIGGVTMDNATRQLHFVEGAPISLTPVEHKLLRCLMERPGEYVSKPELLEHVWGYPPDGGSELVRAHVSNLRRKLRFAGQDGLLRTMPYHGYAFVPPAGSSPN